MTIGIDIDDTLVSTSESFENVKNKYKLDFNKKFKDKWTDSERKFIFDNYLEEILLGAKIKEGAKETLNYLKNKGYKLIVITARSSMFCEDIPKKTIEFLNQEQLGISEVYFSQNKKSDLAKQLNIDLMIDDSDYVYENMKNENIECILFGNKIKTWSEVLDYIKDKE